MRSLRRALLTAATLTSLASLLPAGAAAHRPPSIRERAAIVGVAAAELGSPAFGGQRVDEPCWRVLVSTADERFARAHVRSRAECRMEPADVFWLLELREGGWVTDLLGSGSPCYREAPAERRAVVEDLWGEAGCAPEDLRLELVDARAVVTLDGGNLLAGVEVRCSIACSARVRGLVGGAGRPLALRARNAARDGVRLVLRLHATATGVDGQRRSARARTPVELVEQSPAG